MNQDYTKASEMLRSIDLSFKYECLNILVDFVNICAFPSGGGFDFHTHSIYEFHYIKKGKGYVILDNTRFSLEQGSFYVTAPGVAHKQIADIYNPMVEYALQCSLKLETATETSTSPQSKDEFSHILNTLNQRASRVVIDFQNMDCIYENIFKEIYNKQAGYFTEIKNTILKLVIAASRNLSPESLVEYSVPKRNINTHRIQMIKNYISDNNRRSVTCEELANHLFLSTKQVNRIVKTETGYSIHDYLTSQKIESVKNLLGTTELSLRQIAEQTGFSSEFHLSNMFKKWVGVSPSKYKLTIDI